MKRRNKYKARKERAFMKHSVTCRRFSITGILCRELETARQDETEQPRKGTAPKGLTCHPGKKFGF